MSEPVQIIGSYLSPYVRKVLVVLHLKGIAYEIDPIVPFLGDDRFSAVSPLRRIPVLIDDPVTLADSSVICQYLEERSARTRALPARRRRARARPLARGVRRHAHGRGVHLAPLQQVAIKPFVWGEQTDKAVVEQTLREDVPAVLDYLESAGPGGRVPLRRRLDRRHRARDVLPQRRVRALPRSTPPAGRGPPASSSASSAAAEPSSRCAASRTRRCARRSRSSAPRSPSWGRR